MSDRWVILERAEGTKTEQETAVAKFAHKSDAKGLLSKLRQRGKTTRKAYRLVKH